MKETYCSACHHPDHHGRCGQLVEIDHVEIDCMCVVATPESVDKARLNSGDEAQHQALDKISNRGKR